MLTVNRPVVGGDMDVEYYRPKAGISEVSEHCGYYWLAYDWNNLLGSCPFCNRLRSERAMWPSKSRGGTSGKGSAFPLMHEQFRAWSPDDDVSLEYPLIINPAIDDPVDHIAYDPLGHAIGLTKKGETSIRILGLNARRLYTQRADVIEDVSSLLREKVEIQRDSSATNQSQRIARIDCLIRRRLQPSKPYVAADHAVVRKPAAFGVMFSMAGG